MDQFVAILYVILCIHAAFSNAGNVCNSQDDCKENECCVEINCIVRPKCMKLRQLGDLCVPDGYLNEETGKYRFLCPCKEGLKCSPSEKNSTQVKYQQDYQCK